MVFSLPLMVSMAILGTSIQDKLQEPPALSQILTLLPLPLPGRQVNNNGQGLIPLGTTQTTGAVCDGRLL